MQWLFVYGFLPGTHPPFGTLLPIRMLRKALFLESLAVRLKRLVLAPYLAGTYPESGFAELDPDALLIYFCGRAALDEITDPDADYWTQTRYIIAISPVE